LIDDTIFTSKDDPGARNRYIYYPDHLVRMPGPGQSLWERVYSLFTEPVFTGFVRGLLTEVAQDTDRDASGDESVGKFFSRRVNRSVAENMVSALIHGIYAGDIWKLSMKSLFPLQWHFEKHYGSMVEGLYRTVSQNITVMPERDSNLLLELRDQKLDRDFETKLARCSVFAFRNGLQQLAKALEARLAENGNVTFKTDTRVAKLEHQREAGKIKVRLLSLPSSHLPSPHTETEHRSPHATTKPNHPPMTSPSPPSTPEPYAGSPTITPPAHRTSSPTSS